MGFGLLFVGYFAVTFLTLNTAGFLIRLVGYGIILTALGKLRQYHRAFGLAWWGGVLMLLVSAALALAGVGEFLYESLLISSRWVSEFAMTVLGYVEQVSSLVFHALLLWAIRAIARETEVNKIATNAVRNFVFLCIYEIVYLVGILPVEAIHNATARLGLIALLVYFVCVILNLVLFGSCYAWICDEGDVEMQRKPSHFAFVNRMREKNERRAEKAAAETRAYRQELLEKRKNKKKGGRQR